MGCACLEDTGSSALEGACDSGFLGAAEEAGELAADEEEACTPLIVLSTALSPDELAGAVLDCELSLAGEMKLDTLSYVVHAATPTAIRQTPSAI